MDRITMKKAKQILSLFLSFCMIISCMVGMSVTASAEPAAIGDTGLTWEFDNGTLTISGTGAIPDYESQSARPWNNIKNNITSVNIGDGVTSIGRNAFYHFDNLASVTISNNVTSIGQNAFMYCTKLTTVTIPSSVISIGKTAFGACENLESVTILSGVISISEAAFSGCSKLASVTIPNSVTSIDKTAFSRCTSLTSVTIPSSVTSIGQSAFFNCSNLAAVTFEPRSAEAITTNPTLTIGKHAFDSTKNGAAVAYGTGDAVLFDDTTEIKAGDLLTTIYSTSAEKTLTWKASTPALPAWTNGNVTATLDGTKLTVAKTDNAENGDMGNNGWTKVGSAAAWSSIRGTITEVEIKDGVTSIGNNAFASCTNLANINIPTGVTSIGNLAFGGCTALTSITIPNSVTSIGLQAFSVCNSLSSIIFERPTANSSLSVSSNVFCNFTPPSDFSPSTAAIAYSGTGSYALFDGDTEITTDKKAGDLNNKSLTWKVPTYQWTNGNVIATLDGTKLTVAKTDSAENGDMGNNGWTKVGSAPTWSTIKETITEVEIKDGVTSIGANAFNRCSNLTSVTFPSGLTSIGDAVFANCSALTSVTFPSSLNSIGQRAFHYCTVLASVTFTPGQEGGGLTIGDSAFDDIPSTTKVTYGTGNTVLYDDTTEITTDTLLTAIQRKSLTWKVPTYSITVSDAENGTVTATVGDSTTAVTEAVVGDTVTLTVAPDPGYQLKSVTATTPKEKPETFSDLVSMMGTSVFDGDSQFGYGKYTCAIEENQFALYNGTTLVDKTENVTSISTDSNRATFISGNNSWLVDYTGDKIVGITLADRSTSNVLFISAYPSESNGALVPDEITLTEVAAGSEYTFTMPNKNVTVTAEFEEAAPKDIDISEGTVIADTLFETVTVIVDGKIVPEDAYHVIYFTYEKIEGGESLTRVGTSFPTAAGTYIAAVVANENSGYKGENRSDPFTVSDPDNSYIYGYGPYVQTQTVTTTTTPAPAVTPTPAATTSVKMWAVQNADKSSITVSWDKVSGATKYTLYVRKNGKLEKVVETKKTKVLIKNVANNTDLEYVLKYTINGIESAENSAYTASIKVNYKPAVKLTANKGSVMVKWSKVPDVAKYRVYKYANSKLTLITETTKSAVRVTGTKAGKEYSYAVKALVNGEWTKIYSSDIATVTAK